LAPASLAVFGCSKNGPIVAQAKPAVSIEVTPAVDPPKPANPGELSADTVAKIKSDTAFITDLENGEPTDTGTGFRCENPRWIVTGRHVVTGTDDDVDACRITIGIGTKDERSFRIEPDQIHVVEGITKDQKDYGTRDVAIIELPEDIKGSPLKLASSESLHETQTVWSCGFPDGDSVRTADKEDLPSPSFHVLRVERLDKKDGDVMVMQLAGSPTHGDSGEPVVDGDGVVVGVIEALEREDATILYAVPTSPLQDLIAAVKSGKQMVARKEDPSDPLPDPPHEDPGNTSPPASSDDQAVQTLFDTMASTRITADDLDSLNAKELTILRNVPYARRGLIFGRTDLAIAFGLQPWYHPSTTDSRAVFSEMTDIEKYNVSFIRTYQLQNNLTW
jgi:S1-C subfamily serine protease